jgi:hypothetical protein
MTKDDRIVQKKDEPIYSTAVMKKLLYMQRVNCANSFPRNPSLKQWHSACIEAPEPSLTPLLPAHEDKQGETGFYTTRCPKCNGQTPLLYGASSSTSALCDLCLGQRIIHVPSPVKQGGLSVEVRQKQAEEALKHYDIQDLQDKQFGKRAIIQAMLEFSEIVNPSVYPIVVEEKTAEDIINYYFTFDDDDGYVINCHTDLIKKAMEEHADQREHRVRNDLQVKFSELDIKYAKEIQSLRSKTSGVRLREINIPKNLDKGMTYIKGLDEYNQGWNACIEEFKRLNGLSSEEGKANV